ncbi:acyclic terpene utilization AtuA family protein [uncultured Marinobacter sp.]|uniref:acyclic terpene utilization AtuA family protein n=1 Tax=uncultured Marinobacter sp. TaxID=187379 RepID=UPI0030DCE410
MSDKIVKIGGASGYWGDTALGPKQLLEYGEVDYLILDYLAEITMSILAKARSRDPEAGYATDFIDRVMKPWITRIAEKKIRVIANAGGVNLQACRRALEALAEEAGVTLRIGTVEGDNLLDRADELRSSGLAEMETGASLPDKVMSVNAYLGAFPIAAALDAGADIVITGRCVDSALAVGPLIHEFGWQPEDYDRLSAGGLVGHLIECGAQTSGGNFTDWEETQSGWENTGFPVAEVSADGSFVLTKPPQTGGLVSVLTAGEQMLYEIGDARSYILPDVICDFTQVSMEQVGDNRVLIKGAIGREPTATYKVSATFLQGFACIGNFVIVGRNARARARRMGEAILNRTAAMLAEEGLGRYSKTSLQLVGAESMFGDNARAEALQSREVVLRLGVHHPRKEGVELFSKEFVGAGLSMSPGITGLAPGRPRPSPVVGLFSGLIDKNQVPAVVKVAGETIPVPHAITRGEGKPVAASAMASTAPMAGDVVKVPLMELAVARSGDKGNYANIGVIARKPEYLEAIIAGLAPERVKACFRQLTEGQVTRYLLPGIHGINFLLAESLDGGGVSSLHLDPQAKTYSQVLLELDIPVPVSQAQAWGLV